VSLVFARLHVRLRENAGMSAALAAFLAEPELDRLDAAAIGTPSGEDAETIARVLDEWTDVQAVANLLMHPALIGAHERLRALRRGLAERSHPYLPLAAAVGLQRVASGRMDETDREAFAERLVELIAREPGGLPAMRASVTLNGFLGAGAVERAARLLDHPDRTVRRNVLVALITAVGPEEIGSFVAAAAADGVVSEAARVSAEAELEPLERRRGAGPLGRIDVFASGLGAPELSYIPNLRDSSGVS